MNEKSVIELVRKHVGSHPLEEGFRLEVLESPIKKEGDWWYIPIRSNRPFPKTYQYYDELTQIEDELREQEKIDVFLVPAA